MKYIENQLLQENASIVIVIDQSPLTERTFQNELRIICEITEMN